MQNELKRTVDLSNYLQKGKVLIIYGARQVGKTTIVKQFLSETAFKHAYYSGDDLSFGADFSKCELNTMKNIVHGLDLVVIDEAQKIENIGTALKLIVDNYPDLHVIATGSSSFDLANAAEEPLTGRKNVITLYPIAVQELIGNSTPYEVDKKIDDILIYGSYPEVLLSQKRQAKEQRITEIMNSYLIKDILEFQLLKRSKVILDLLKLIAFQIGNQVSTVEIGKQIGLDYKTVQRYLDLLEKSFVLVPLHGFSRNLRKEVSKMSMYYFMDLGIRNAVIANFNPLNSRDDVGQLWENFLFIERLKRNEYINKSVNYYYWRTYDQKEIDLIEESGGKLNGYEFKWSVTKKAKAPEEWISTYKNASWELVNRENYLDFVK